MRPPALGIRTIVRYARAVADAYGGAAAFDAVRFDPQTVRQLYFRVLVDG